VRDIKHCHLGGKYENGGKEKRRICEEKRGNTKDKGDIEVESVK
jgi:hypothetical protein